MPQPPEYERQHDFAEELGSTHGVHLDDEFDNIKVTSDAVRANLAKIQRDDGALRNQIVTRDSLDPSIALGFDPPTDWQPNTSYTPTSAVFYGSAMWLSKEAHISGDVFDPDQWDRLTDFAALTVEAEAARDVAVAAATAAQADREQAGLDRAQTAADRQQTAADRVATGEDRAASETAAQTAATQAGIATTKAGEAAGAAAQAAADRVQTGLDRQATQQAAGEAATSAQQAADAAAVLDVPIGKPITDPATAITGSLLSGAMLAAGAIVEMGENANGLYWRWESGLQVCVSYLPTGPWTYPARFGAERPFVFGTPIDGGNLGMIAGVGSSAELPTSTATTVTIRDTNPPAVRYNHSGNWVAIGLWK